MPIPSDTLGPPNPSEANDVYANLGSLLKALNPGSKKN
jgi:hypothetical protein